VRRTLLLAIWLSACGDGRDPDLPPLTVYAAASLARPLATAAESFQEGHDIAIQTELGGSMELARRMTDLGGQPDVVLLADDEVVAALLPEHLDWYVRFATSRLVIAYTPRSRHADSIDTENWWRLLSRGDVAIGRADSALAPAGRHALSVLRRAEGYYDQDDLAGQLLARAGPAFVRPNAAELAALLEAGEVDYILEYESVARQYGFRYVSLPADLAPRVLYGASVPRRSTRVEDGVRFVAFLLGDEGVRILRASNVDVLRIPVAVGENVPPAISEIVRTIASVPAR
jgi:molybdate/tungstate transport system substrate-binding protein